MVTVVVIFGVAYLLIASGKIPPVLVAVLGAIAMVLLGVISEQQALSYVNLEVILLLAAMMSLAEMAGRTGVFEWAAIRSAQLAGGSGFRTLCLMAGFTAVASALLDNVTVVVLMIPVTLSVCRTLNVSPVPFLLAQVFASNIGGVSTVIADPPNIIVAASGGIGFVDFMLNVAPVGVISTGVLFIVLYVWFRKQVVTTAASREAVMRQNAGDAIKDRILLIKVCVVLAVTMVGFLIHDALNVEPAFVALAGATILVLISRLDPQDVVQHVEWTTLAFFAGLFMLVGGLVETGVTLEIRDWMVDASGDSERNLAFLLVWFGGFASAIVDNVPYTAMMAEVVQGASQGSDGHSPLWWALTLGADLGGNATIVGASANVVAVSLARTNGVPISFMQFFRYGVVISAVTLAISTGYLWLRYYS